MKNKINRRKYFVGNKKLKHVKLFENFDSEMDNVSILKKLPSSIKNTKDVERFILALASENLMFHFDDDALDLVGEPFTKEEGIKINDLMDQAFEVCEKKWGDNGFWEGFVKEVSGDYVMFGADDEGPVYVVKGNGSGGIKKATREQYGKFKDDHYDSTLRTPGSADSVIDRWFKSLPHYMLAEAVEDGLNPEIRAHMKQFGAMEVEDYYGEFTVGSDITLETFATGDLKLRAGDTITVAEGKMPLCFTVKFPRGITQVRMIDMMRAQDAGDIYSDLTYKLSDGKTLHVEETGGQGMAGEPMSMVLLKVDGKIVHFDDVKSKMDPRDAQELQAYLTEVGDSNDASARQWTE